MITLALEIVARVSFIPSTRTIKRLGVLFPQRNLHPKIQGMCSLTPLRIGQYDRSCHNRL